MKKHLILGMAALIATTVSAQVINGDMDHDSKITVEDVTMLIDGYLTGKTEVLAPADVDTGLIVGAWSNLTKEEILTFRAGGTLAVSTTSGAAYSFYYRFPTGGVLQFLDDEDYSPLVTYDVICLNEKYLVIRTGDNVEIYQPYGTLEYSCVDLGLSVNWATMNVGASVPEDWGDYFAWGETAPKSDYQWKNYKYCKGSNTSLTKYNTHSEYGTVDGKTVLELSDDAANVNWGGLWRTPTYEELEELRTLCTWEQVNQNGRYGFTVTGPNGNSIFLPTTGYYRNGTHYYSDGDDGSCNYMSSTLYSSQDYNNYYLYARYTTVDWYSIERYLGMPVRPVVAKNLLPVTGITLSEGSLKMLLDESRKLVAMVSPLYAENVGVVWTSSDESVATVSATGVVEAVAAGIATITCTAADGSGVTATCEVTVQEPFENGHEYVDLGLSVKWATMNIGATAPEDYGDYFAWGETKTKSTYNWSTYKLCYGSNRTLTKYCTISDLGTVEYKTVLDLTDDAAYVNWGGNWRMPTNDEWTDLREKCTWEWTTQNGVYGYMVTASNGNSIFLPAAGYRNDGALNYVGSNGLYWSSSLFVSHPPYAWYMGFDSSSVSRYNYNRYYGLSVRAVCP